MSKVCHVTSAHRSDDVRIFQKECVSLASAGYDTYLVAQGESREEKGVHVVGIGENAPASRIRRMTEFSGKIYKKALELDADIYHLHDPELLPYGLKLKKKGKRVIFDSHENTLEQMREKAYIPTALRPLVSNFYSSYAKRVFKHMDALISVTPHIIDQLRAVNPNTWMITNYPLLRAATDTSKRNHDEFILCFSGGIDQQWSHGAIIDCIAGDPAVTYELCGSGEEAYINELKAKAGWKNVRFHGKVSHDEALNIQRNADVGMAILQPGRNTGFMTGTIGNTKLFEYMMSEIPVICTDFDLWKNIINEYDCGICVASDKPEEILEAIRYLRRNSEKAKQMGANGRKAVEQEFNWETQEEKLTELYKKII